MGGRRAEGAEGGACRCRWRWRRGYGCLRAEQEEAGQEEAGQEEAARRRQLAGGRGHGCRRTWQTVELIAQQKPTCRGWDRGRG